MIDKYNVEPMDMKGIESFKAIRKRNLNGIVVAHLNINSVRNTFDYLIGLSYRKSYGKYRYSHNFGDNA